ncbi:MAG TPA: hypothetical protein PLN52_26730 [Opitutaceae bacterium]|nr:hypothetical protein [Opitutaceae bacterium]
MDTSIIVALIGALGTVIAAVIERAKTTNLKKPRSGEQTSVSRSRFWLTLLLGLSITANAVLFVAVKPWSKPPVPEESDSTKGASGTVEPIVKTTGNNVEITCPPGYYIYGITYSLQPGGANGQVYTISPLIKPFPGK